MDRFLRAMGKPSALGVIALVAVGGLALAGFTAILKQPTAATEVLRGVGGALGSGLTGAGNFVGAVIRAGDGAPLGAA